MPPGLSSRLVMTWVTAGVGAWRRASAMVAGTPVAVIAQAPIVPAVTSACTAGMNSLV
jgi:hypothetical protein